MATKRESIEHSIRQRQEAANALEDEIRSLRSTLARMDSIDFIRANGITKRNTLSSKEIGHFPDVTHFWDYMAKVGIKPWYEWNDHIYATPKGDHRNWRTMHATPAFYEDLNQTPDHYIKLEKRFVQPKLEGRKGWELRRNDRIFLVGDSVEFTIVEGGVPTGETLGPVLITYILTSAESFAGLHPEMCIFSHSEIQVVASANLEPKGAKIGGSLPIVKAIQTSQDKWKALEKAIGASMCRQWVYMSSVVLADTTIVHCYKHGITSKYVNFSDDGKAWDYAGTGYSRIPLAEAIQFAISQG